jgi:DNA-binding XRE family transcriptional regulator
MTCYDFPSQCYDLTPVTFKHMRRDLGLTQRQLAHALGYQHKIRVSEFERETNPVPIPHHIQRAMINASMFSVPMRTVGKVVRRWVRKELNHDH